jgi:hypothetical protein
MADRANAGRSGKRTGREGRDAGHGSKDLGESGGQMKQKAKTNSPQAKNLQVKPGQRFR